MWSVIEGNKASGAEIINTDDHLFELHHFAQYAQYVSNNSRHSLQLVINYEEKKKDCTFIFQLLCVSSPVPIRNKSLDLHSLICITTQYWYKALWACRAGLSGMKTLDMYNFKHRWLLFRDVIHTSIWWLQLSKNDCKISCEQYRKGLWKIFAVSVNEWTTQRLTVKCPHITDAKYKTQLMYCAQMAPCIQVRNISLFWDDL